MTDTVKLIVRAGGEINKPFLLIGEKNVIGRDPKNDIVIDDIEISRNHLTITRKGDTFQIEDNHSTNGTFLNGMKLEEPTVIKNGDLISLGQNHVLEFVFEKVEKNPESLPLNETDEPKITQVEKEKQEDEKLIKERAQKVDLDKEDLIEEISNQKFEDQKKPTWVVILLTALAFILIFCVIPLIVIETTNQWCNLFAGFFNSMSPGVCP
ncbi:MAG: FHA domain-containing protein [Anaerolineaceae bacterium]|nr:FHA domain-containing protein [Anaerolineaceae bacterium]